MNSESETSLEDAAENPLEEFSGCHDGIIRNFDRLRDLVALIDKTPDSPDIREIATKLLKFFENVVYEHHAEEEQELFTAVMDCAGGDEESALAKDYIKRLVAEHRELESMWKRIEGDVWRLSRGKAASLDATLADKLAQQYLAHATFEEQTFLPLSARMLSKKNLAALGRSLHMRHQDKTAPFFI